MRRYHPAKSTLAMLIPTLMLISPAVVSANPADDVRPGTVVFKSLASASPSELKGLNALLKSQGLESEETLPNSQITIATFKGKGREKAIANILKHSGLVEFAEPDFVVAPDLQPNDPSFSNQWHHTNIKSRQAWDITTGSNNVLVAVCDTGFDADHPDLAANLRLDLAYNAQDDTTYIDDKNGHGTGTAGTLGAVGNNGTGVAGVNWNVDIIPVRIAISDTNSSAYISTMAKCIEYAADNGARVVNLSYGGIEYATIDAAAKYLRARNGLLFMSAGNSGTEYPDYPDYTSFVGVGATGSNDTKTSFSDWGTYVDLTAPGSSIRTTYLNGTYTNYSGTSFSSPVAAGVAALMVSANPAITADEIEAGMFATAVDIGATGDDVVYGHGLVDAYAAVNYAMNLGSLVAPVASITANSNSVPFGSAVSLSALNSSDPDGEIVSYLWQLGDGTTSTQAQLIHTYATAGAFQVSLTVTDNDGLTHSASTTIQVTNDLPQAVIDSMPGQYNMGADIYFSATGSSDSDGEIVSYEWDFGNGEYASGVTTSYNYPAPGNYTVTLTVTDNAGAINSSSIDISVIDPMALSAPGNLSAQTDGLNVTLNWQDTSGSEDYFIIERAVKFRGKVYYETVGTVPANSTEYIDTVPGADNYWYQITAVNSLYQATSTSIQVAVSDSSTQPTPDPEPQPGSLAAPTNLYVSQSGNTVNIVWTDNNDDELGFYLERGLKAKGSIQFERIAVLGQNVSSAIDSASVLSSGNYAYRVQAYKDGVTSAYSNIFELRLK